ncbi:hypothetical protein MPL1032_30113 [Mesorhizobium plurifarium]|uniref:Uncharacterized protein n=1 Tax=Mesorhizobium plurifarium TaxID=69974 RepID=A0A0K2W3F4_MESPL|nr:hypothetical protein MPL1032_30113 [Mesorhizobium plurifarium]
MQNKAFRKISRLGRDGAQRRIRTTDTRIFSPLLYQLSYLGLCRLTGSPAGFHEGTRRRPLKARGL